MPTTLRRLHDPRDRTTGNEKPIGLVRTTRRKLAGRYVVIPRGWQQKSVIAAQHFLKLPNSRLAAAMQHEHPL
jgi:hypothetical protein